MQGVALDLGEHWNAMLDVLRRSVGHQEVEIWLGDAKPLNENQHELVISVPNQYYVDWIEENYRKALEEEASIRFERPMALLFQGKDTPPPQDTPTESTPTTTRPSQPIQMGVKKNQTFNNFVVGSCNQFAHAAAGAVAERPASTYNPLFIYGATGLGKTHLMHAIANHVLEQTSSARIVYVTAEDFMNEMIRCLRHKRMEDFRSKYRRRATILFVDDIQFLSGRERTQEEFFHTFNALQNSGRQVVLTSDVEPKNIEKLEPRLRTRFEGGLLADIQAPDKETMLAILSQKSEELGLAIPSDLADAITHQVQGNIRELEGLLIHLNAKLRFFNERLTLGFARKHLPAVFDPAPTYVTVSAIIEAVAKFHNIRSADITGVKRTRSLTRPRHIAMYLSRTHTQLSFPELGKEFGGRDHSTVQHGHRKVYQELHKKQDPDLITKVKLIEQTLNVTSTLDG